MVPEWFNPPPQTIEQQYEQYLFFEHVRLMRLHHTNWKNDKQASDYRLFKLNQYQVDQYLKKVVKLRYQEQPELFE
jgi:hypothetical protein